MVPLSTLTFETNVTADDGLRGCESGVSGMASKKTRDIDVPRTFVC